MRELPSFQASSDLKKNKKDSWKKKHRKLFLLHTYSCPFASCMEARTHPLKLTTLNLTNVLASFPERRSASELKKLRFHAKVSCKVHLVCYRLLRKHKFIIIPSLKPKQLCTCTYIGYIHMLNLKIIPPKKIWRKNIKKKIYESKLCTL